ncbi:LapA family protein [Methylophaga sp.]|uniref:LapA family protein n=1 Tax=Methylophaga sp. TaxID=2024840 RepID=UPI003F699C4F
MRKIFFLVIFILIFLISAAFAAFNMNAVTVNYYFGDLTMPLSALLVIAILLGVLLGAIVLVLATLKLRYENRRLKSKLSVSEQEIDSLRILPIKDSH